MWVGGWSPSKDHCLLDSVTGAIMECFSPPAGNAWGGYGCLVDSVNVLWGSGGYGNYQLFRKAPGQAPTAVGGIPNYIYGLGLDKRTYRRCYRLCTPRPVSVVPTPPLAYVYGRLAKSVSINVACGLSQAVTCGPPACRTAAC